MAKTYVENGKICHGMPPVHCPYGIKYQDTDIKRNGWSGTARLQDKYEHETSYTVSPATWLISLGVHHGLHLRCFLSSTQGWKNTMKTICPVPDGALIFDFCKAGNVPAVRRLLSGGLASVRDTDSGGYTPLHVSTSGEILAA